jgi:hypothetical protein
MPKNHSGSPRRKITVFAGTLWIDCHFAKIAGLLARNSKPPILTQKLLANIS